MDQLLPLTVLIESHDCDSTVLAQSYLDVDPFVHWQENGVRIGHQPVVLGKDIDSEGRL